MAICSGVSRATYASVAATGSSRGPAGPLVAVEFFWAESTLRRSRRRLRENGFGQRPAGRHQNDQNKDCASKRFIPFPDSRTSRAFRAADFGGSPRESLKRDRRVCRGVPARGGEFPFAGDSEGASERRLPDWLSQAIRTTM